ncbi:ANTAR domain-containing protein [Mesotoga sp.]|uniref:ANTAR domain-containing protein n=1 Tax=Mesotoga sp. TaxID=2053577 RepID=UPI002BCAB839|nr:ANTAR domain-containing protein [Mesotoga sp.]HRX66186.1 ANTAR domain-containing protein [Mesotoga sp.]
MERAKGILMDRNGIRESEAMKLLQKISRDRNLKLVAVAKEIIEADNALHYGI